jgi:glycine cleavage system transcriptional repressor
MQLAITLLSDNPIDAISELIVSCPSCGCRIVDVKSSRFGDLHCAYLLVEGNWNQLTKYESTLHAIEKKMSVKISSQRIEKKRAVANSTPYFVEIVGLENNDILQKVISFLGEKDIEIEEINGRSHTAPYLDIELFSIRLIILIPQNLSLFVLREELMYVCDQVNADIVFEPFGVNK